MTRGKLEPFSRNTPIATPIIHLRSLSSTSEEAPIPSSSACLFLGLFSGCDILGSVCERERDGDRVGRSVADLSSADEEEELSWPRPFFLVRLEVMWEAERRGVWENVGVEKTLLDEADELADVREKPM